MLNDHVQRALWAIILAVILGSGTFMLNSRDATTKLNAQVISTEEKIDVLQSNQIMIREIIQELRIDNSKRDESIENMKEISKELKEVTGILKESVIRLEERNSSKN